MSRISYVEDFEQWSSDFEFYRDVQVRFSETDMFGHLNNTVPFTYFEMARIEYLKAIGLADELLSSGGKSIIVVADLQCDYLQQVYFDDMLHVYVKAHKLGKSSVDLHYLAKKGDQVCFTGRGTIVNMEKATGKSTPWTENMRERMLGKKKELVK